jgi:hypothetical protein
MESRKLVLKERAEELNYEELMALSVENSRLQLLLTNYLSEYLRSPLFLLGPKGSGKTFNIMRFLSKNIKKNEDFLPVMLTYSPPSYKERILHPFSFCSPDAWKVRYDIFSSATKEELMEKASIIIYDDIHYRCENIIRGKESVENLVNDLRRILNKVKEGGKAILVSEDLLYSYAKTLRSEKLNEILPSFGQVPPFYPTRESRGRWMSLIEGINYLALYEVPPLTYEEWQAVVKNHGINFDEPTNYLLYFHLSRQPRAAIRLAKMFYPETHIKIEAVYEKGKELFFEKRNPKKRKKFYELLFRHPVLRSPLPPRAFSHTFRYLLESVGSVEKLLELSEVTDISLLTSAGVPSELRYLRDSEIFWILKNATEKERKLILSLIEHAENYYIFFKPYEQTSELSKKEGLRSKAWLLFSPLLEALYEIIREKSTSSILKEFDQKKFN